MTNSSTGTLIIATLLSIVGWIGVTLYSETTNNRKDIRDLAIKVGKMEVNSATNTGAAKGFISIGTSVTTLIEDHAKHKASTERDIRELEDKVNGLIREELRRSRELGTKKGS